MAVSVKIWHRKASGHRAVNRGTHPRGQRDSGDPSLDPHGSFDKAFCAVDCVESRLVSIRLWSRCQVAWVKVGSTSLALLALTPGSFRLVGRCLHLRRTDWLRQRVVPVSCLPVIAIIAVVLTELCKLCHTVYCNYNVSRPGVNLLFLYYEASLSVLARLQLLLPLWLHMHQRLTATKQRKILLKVCGGSTTLE